MGVDMQHLDSDVAVVSMDWPEKRNALGPADTAQVGLAIEEAAALPVSGVVLTGTGAFCAGGGFGPVCPALDGDLARRSPPAHLCGSSFGATGDTWVPRPRGRRGRWRCRRARVRLRTGL